MRKKRKATNISKHLRHMREEGYKLQVLPMSGTPAEMRVKLEQACAKTIAETEAEGKQLKISIQEIDGHLSVIMNSD